MKKENTHLVIKREDIKKYLNEDEQKKLDRMTEKIAKGRQSDGRCPENSYYICNKDESYAELVEEVIMKGEEKMRKLTDAATAVY